MEQSASKSTCRKLWQEVKDCQRRTSQIQNLFQSDEKNIAFVLQQSNELSLKISVLEWELIGLKLVENLVEQYEDAKELAVEFSPKQAIPSKQQLREELMKLGRQKICEIARFGRPTLLMTPPTTMRDKLFTIDTNRKYVGADSHVVNQGQVSLVGRPPTDILWNPQPKNLLISIVDGLPNKPENQDENCTKSLRELYLEKNQQLKHKGQRMITTHEWLILEHGSLKRYNIARNDRKNKSHQNPQIEIVDFDDTAILHDTTNVASTIFECNPHSSDMPCGSFEATSCKIYLETISSTAKFAFARFRPAITVFEY